jgi:CBS domain containing-hemolysin-like protein
VLGLVVAVLFIGLNGFFVAAEFALVKVRATQLHSRARKGEKKAIVAHRVVTRLDRYLSVTQFGITLASLGLGWIGEPALEAIADQAAKQALGHDLGNGLHIAIVALAFGTLTFSHVLLGELVPKLIAIERSEGTALLAAIPLQVVFYTFRPLLWLLETASRVILRAMGMSAGAGGEGTNISEDEILGILAAQAQRGRGGKEKSLLIERVMRFSQRTARHAMVPRVDVASLPIETSGEAALEKMRHLEFSRVVLSKVRSLDEVAGYLYVKDFLLDPEAVKLPNLWPLRRDALFVPETQNLVDVLREMQRAHTPIAVVVDEYGGTSGIITMEDLLEEIVGEIRDETDEELARVTKLHGEEGAFDVDARATMDELRPVGVTVTTDEAAEPVGAAVLARLGRLPRKGDTVELAPNASAEITAVSRRRVVRVRVRLKKAEAAPV